MPLPLLAIVPVLVTWGTRAVATYGLARLFSEEPVQELKRVLFGYIVEYAARYAGLNLNQDDPISDASFSAAVSERLGFQIRTLKDMAMVKEDVEGYALLLVEQRSGYHISSLSDVGLLKADLARISLQVLSGQVGIPLAAVDGVFSPEAIRGQVLSWGKAQLLANLGGEAGLVVQEIIEMGGLEAVAQDLNSRLSELGSLESVTARQLAVRVAEKMAAGAVADFGRVAIGMNKRNRKRELGRAAQAKFRRLHGNRQKYVPLGMSAAIG